MKLLFTILISAIGSILFPGLGMEIKVSLYNENNISSLIFSPLTGTYYLIADGRQLEQVAVSEPVYLTAFGDYIMLSRANGYSGIYKSVHFGSENEISEFSLRPLHIDLDVREYFGSVTFSVEFKRLKIINRVNIELYLTGVVEAEAGYNSSPEFYKAQATVCRIYALRQLDRHQEEGFNLCDEVHCQVYKGRLRRYRVIFEATIATQGMVIIDSDSMLITGAFHAHCGGQTANAEDVWLVSRPYLRSVIDPFCVKRNRRNWERIIKIEDWKHYLIANGFNANILQLDPGRLRFYQDSRTAYYRISGDSLPLSKIRNHWRLRSTFFSIDTNHNLSEIVIRGKGFGHGIGMCQEGAIQMAEEGKTWKEIINFYFHGVSVINYSNIKNFQF